MHAGMLHVLVDLVLHPRGRRAAPLGIREHVHLGETDAFDCLEALAEQLIRFPGEANDDIRRNGNVRHEIADHFDFMLKLFDGVLSSHALQYFVAACLQRDMEVAAHFRGILQHLKHTLVDLACFNRTDPDAAKSFYFVQIPKQVG
ncbi:hypothetical protein D3C81_941700 [compost metagenome]